MGLMFARRRIEEAAKRAAHKAKAQGERHKEARAANGQAPALKGKPNGADSKGTK
jgi:hypothetical protein